VNWDPVLDFNLDPVFDFDSNPVFDFDPVFVFDFDPDPDQCRLFTLMRIRIQLAKLMLIQ
jgi:hypothetical protein